MKNREGMQYNIHVNEEKGVVAVRIINGVSQLANEFAMFCQKNDTYFDGAYFESFMEKYKKQINKIVGLATCNFDGGDSFDINFGTQLAQERAMAYFETYRTKMYNGFCLRMDSIAECASIRAELSYARRCDRIDRVNDLIEELKHQ